VGVGGGARKTSVGENRRHDHFHKGVGLEVLWADA